MHDAERDSTRPGPVRRIAVLRAGGLGDLLLALPAIRALGDRYPEAEVTLLGTAAAEELLGARPGAPHRVVTLPPIPGVGVPASQRVDRGAVERFVREMRGQRFDLALQMHGGGRYSNPLVADLRARCSAGPSAPGAIALDRSIDYVYAQHEAVRWLEVAALVGAVPGAMGAMDSALELTAAEAAARAERGRRPSVVIHPGASDPRRRWPVARFAETASRLAAAGVAVRLVGSGDADVAACAEIASAVAPAARGRGPVEDLSGRLALTELATVLAGADVMVGNDSGPRHLAEALGTRTVAVFWCGNLINAGPFGRARHRVQVSWTTACPVCGRECVRTDAGAERCPHDVSFVGDVAAEAVYGDIERMLELAGSER